MEMFRRSLLRSSAIGVVAVAAAGCSTLSQTFDSTLKTVVDDINLGAQAAVTLLSQLSGLNISSATMTTISGIVNDISGVATGVDGVSSTAAAQPWVTKLATYVNMLIPIVSAIPGIPGVVGMVLAGLSALAPGLATILNMALPASAPPVPGQPAMSLPQARLVLSTYTMKK